MSDSNPNDAAGSYEDTAPATETTNQSWFSRIGGALVGLLIGVLLVPGGSFLLFWNEGRAVTTARSLTEGAGVVRTVAAEQVQAALEGQLVHVAGTVTGGTPPRDAELGVAPPAGTLRLVRQVEMYQWKEEQQSETRNRLGGGTETVTTYRYSRVWETGRIDSSRFREAGSHSNPQPRYSGQAWTARGARLGAFALGEAQLSLLPADQALGDPRAIGQDPANPRIGDLRVSWRIIQPDAVSVLAAQVGEGFAPYATRAGDRLMMVAPGRVPAATMFQQAEQNNVVLTWVLRGGGALVVFLGFLLFLSPAKVLASFIPAVGGVVGFSTAVLAAVLTLLVAPLAIALAWLAYRPLLGIAVLAAGLLAALGVGLWRGLRPARARAA